MNPEYVYKQKLYKVTLMGDKAGRNINSLTQLFQQAKYPPQLERDWQYLIGKPVIIAEWPSLSEQIALTAVKALRHHGASPNIYEYERLTVFDDASLSQDFTRRYAAIFHHLKQQENPNALAKWQEDTLGFINNWYSKTLLNLDEPALRLWAKAEAVEESYRLSILPSFHPAKVIRVSRNRDSIQLIYKVGEPPFSDKRGLDNQTKAGLDPELFEELRQFMDKNFWAADSWYSWYGASVLDGTVLLFEGWKDGQYKFLDDHSPTKDKIAYKAHALFSEIVRKTQKP